MLQEFIAQHETEIVSRCRISAKRTSQPAELVQLFLGTLVDVLRSAVAPNSATREAGSQHCADLVQGGFTVMSVVDVLTSVPQAVTSLAKELGVVITPTELETLDLYLDHAAAGAVTAQRHA